MVLGLDLSNFSILWTKMKPSWIHWISSKSARESPFVNCEFYWGKHALSEKSIGHGRWRCHWGLCDPALATSSLPPRPVPLFPPEESPLFSVSFLISRDEIKANFCSNRLHLKCIIQWLLKLKKKIGTPLLHVKSYVECQFTKQGRAKRRVAASAGVYCKRWTIGA